MDDVTLPAPNVDPEVAAFWEATRRDVLVLPRCRQCEQFHWYPRGACPHCLSTDIEWVESHGLGKIYSCTTFHRGGAPRVIAYVELAEGLRLLTNILPGSADTAIGRSVRVTFVPSSGEAGFKIPFFVADLGE